MAMIASGIATILQARAKGPVGSGYLCPFFLRAVVSRGFDPGISLIFGLSVEIVPQLYRTVPDPIRPLFDSALSLTTVLVVLLNLLFRFGVAKRRKFELVPSPDNRETITRIMEEQGAAWGMRKEVELRAIDALTEFMTSAQMKLQLCSPAVAVQVEFDEFKLEIDIDYDGIPVHLPQELPPVEALGDEAGIALLSGYMIRQFADSVKVTCQGGHCRVHQHFEH